jgi:hypothetical protein
MPIIIGVVQYEGSGWEQREKRTEPFFRSDPCGELGVRTVSSLGRCDTTGHDGQRLRWRDFDRPSNPQMSNSKGQQGVPVDDIPFEQLVQVRPLAAQ